MGVVVVGAACICLGAPSVAGATGLGRHPVQVTSGQDDWRDRQRQQAEDQRQRQQDQADRQRQQAEDQRQRDECRRHTQEWRDSNTEC